MTWIFSEALVTRYGSLRSLQEQAGASSLAASSAGEPSAPSNEIPTPHLYLCSDKTTERSIPSLYGMTFAHLTASRGEDLLTSFRGAFPARTYQWLAKEQESQEPAADCGATWPGLLAKYDRHTSSWRTPLSLFGEDSKPFSATLPKSGIMLDGMLWARTTLAPRIAESVSGLWASSMWPTPTVHGNNNRAGISPKAGDGLNTAVRKYATPTVQDAKNNAGPSQFKRNSLPLNTQVVAMADAPESTLLNPDWVEWLMGWPIGWTNVTRPMPTHLNVPWAIDPADMGWLPRLTGKTDNRTRRIVCLGNGQVPKCAAMAFTFLAKDLEAQIEGIAV